MNDLINFLVSEEAILVYIIALIVSIIYVFYCVIKNTSHNRKKKQNTMELNRLVEEVKSADKVSGVTTSNNNIVNNVNTIKSEETVLPATSVEVVTPIAKEEKKEVKELVVENKEKEVVPIMKESKEDLEVKKTIQQEVLPISVNNNIAVNNEIANSETVKMKETLLKTVPIKDVVEKSPEILNTKVETSNDTFNSKEANTNGIKTESLEDDIPCIKIIEEEFIPIEETIKENKEEISSEKAEVISNNEELVYTSIEPEKEEAKKQLAEITEKLEQEKEEENIELTEFERMQEDTAIISLDELMKKAGELYERNEEVQYQDEGNEPISLADLEKRKNEVVAIKEDEKREIIEDKQEIKIDELEEKKITTVSELKPISDDHKFKSSPVISPVYGLEQDKKEVNRNTELELENTANFEKLDAEIRKSNQFIAVLKELQKKLD